METAKTARDTTGNSVKGNSGKQCETVLQGNSVKRYENSVTGKQCYRNQYGNSENSVRYYGKRCETVRNSVTGKQYGNGMKTVLQGNSVTGISTETAKTV